MIYSSPQLPSTSTRPSAPPPHTDHTTSVVNSGKARPKQNQTRVINIKKKRWARIMRQNARKLDPQNDMPEMQNQLKHLHRSHIFSPDSAPRCSPSSEHVVRRVIFLKALCRAALHPTELLSRRAAWCGGMGECKRDRQILCVCVCLCVIHPLLLLISHMNKLCNRLSNIWKAFTRMASGSFSSQREGVEGKSWIELGRKMGEGSCWTLLLRVKRLLLFGYFNAN